MLFSAFLLDKKDNCEDGGGGDGTCCEGNDIAQSIEMGLLYEEKKMKC